MRLANVGAVAVRDFLAVVRTKGFVIGLLFMPLMILVSSQLPRLLARFEETGERRFAVVDFTGRLVAPFTQEIARTNAIPGQKMTIVVEPVDPTPLEQAPGKYAVARDELRARLGARIRSHELFGYVIAGPRVADLPASENENVPVPADAQVTFGAVSLTAGDVRSRVSGALTTSVRAVRLAELKVDPSLARRLTRGVELDEFVESARGGEKSSGAQEAIVPTVLMALLLMGVLQSGGLLLTSTIEEKSNRVVEVLVSSISPFELLAGKVLGAWLTGLVMLLAWGGAGAYAASEFHVLRSGIVSPLNLFWFVYFFLVGYLLFASLYAAIGAMCSSIQDAQSMMLPVVILIMIPFLSLGFVINHPDSGLSVALSWFPFSAPFVAVLRVALSPPSPIWQTALSAAIVAASAIFFMWLGGKVFRVAILMTGKPPKPSEIWRMLRTS
jgi:ABC-2 type transport system permease protein